MSNTRIEITINSEKRFLESLYPVEWTAFISNAKIFNSIEDARLNLNYRFAQLSESLNHNTIHISDIRLVTIDNGRIIHEEFYLRR